MVSLNQADTERITRFLDLQTALPPHADLAFVFGTHHPDPAHIAAHLWNEGMVARVMLTGGPSRLTGETEATGHLAILVQNRVPRDRIVVETESTNTEENVLFALRALAIVVPSDEVHSVVAVAKWYHCRRAIMTLKRHMPPGVRYFATTYEVDGVTRSGWWLTEEGRRRVMKERDLISQGLGRGDIAQVREDGGAFI